VVSTHWGERQPLLLAGLSYIHNTSGEMSEEEATQENWDPMIASGIWGPGMWSQPIVGFLNFPQIFGNSSVKDPQSGH
jgi:hypothetical protein